MVSLLLSDPTPLRLTDSVAVVLITPEGHYLLQHRWNRPGFYFPGFWGLFGGGMKLDETPEFAAAREIREELGLVDLALRPISKFDFDFSPLALRKIQRWYFSAQLSQAEIERIHLTEGDEFRSFSAHQALSDLQIVYYDAFAIWAIESQQRLGSI